MTLTGHVEHYGAKSAAGKAVGGAPGVRAVVDEREVCLPSSLVKHGDEIAAAAVDRFNRAVLSGTASSWLDRAEAEAKAWAAPVPRRSRTTSASSSKTNRRPLSGPEGG